MKYLKLFDSNTSDYSISITPEIYHHGVTVENSEIDDITCNSLLIKYLIDIDSREWGIKGISVYNFNGPTEIELDVTYYLNDTIDNKSVLINLDWDKSIIEKNTGQGVICISNIKIDLTNDGSGNLIAKSITIEVNEL